MPWSKIGALALAVTIPVVVGCGGSSKSTSSGASQNSASTTSAPVEEIKVQTGKPMALAVWIKKGDGICARTNTKLSTTTAKTNADFARLLPQAAGYERIEATELSKLVPPADKAGDWQQVITDLQKFSELSVRAAEYARVNNFAQAQPVADAGNKAQQEMVAIAKQDGFKVCSVP